MRLLLLNQFYPPDVAPTGQMLHDLARTLVARGHEVHVVCSRRSYDGGAHYAPRENLEGVLVHRLPALGLGRRTLAGRLADYASFCAVLLGKALLGLPPPHLVLALTTPPYLGLLARAMARLRGSAHAHWVMDLYPDVMVAHGLLRPRGLVLRFLASLARSQMKGSRIVLCLGPRMAERVAAYVRAPSLLDWVPLWGEDAAQASLDGEGSLRRERGWEGEALVLMWSGNMGLGHRFGEFLEAAARLGPSGPLWTFVGGGARRSEIESFLRSHPGARVELLPPVPRSRLCESLSAADVHLVSLARAWQGLMIPSKIQASFSLGRPVIFVGPRDNEVARWIEESGGGWIAPEDDVEGLLACVGESRDPAERARRGAAALQYAREHFDRARNCGRIAELLERALVGP